MRDVELLRRRVCFALTTIGLLTLPLAACKGEAGAPAGEAGHEGEASHEGEAGHEQRPVGEAVGEGEGEAAEAAPGLEGEGEPPNTMAIDPDAGHAPGTPDGGESGEGESGEGESGEGESGFNYYAVPSDPYAVPSEGEAADCPQGDWCGPVDKAKLFEAEGAERVMGCPYKIAANGASMKRVDTDAAVWKEFSFDKRMQGRLSNNHTEAQRKEQGTDDLCCYHWYNYCSGRPLRDGTAAVVAPTVADPSASWTSEEVGEALENPVTPVADHLAQRLADAWLEDAQMEHASVGSFARATLELMALGAPPDLLAGVQRAAADEVAHAQACFDLHARYAGRPLAPGPLPPLAPRESSFARLAEDTFDEGCVGETIAALVAARSARACEDPRVRATLVRIADDEGGHAALAWKTLEWALGEAEPRVGRDLLRRARRTLAELERSAPPRAEPGGAELARHGRASERERAAAATDAWRSVIVPTLEALVSARA